MILFCRPAAGRWHNISTTVSIERVWNKLGTLWINMINNADVHVLYRDTRGLDGAAVELAGRNLSVEERKCRDRFHFEADRRDFTIAHDLLRRGLSRRADVVPTEWRFATSDYGKPFIDSADPELKALSFSLSYTRGYVACAITESAQVGIDVESIDHSQTSQRVADKFFSEEEASWLRQCPDDQRNTHFTELWTLKEALLKATGVGLSGLPALGSFYFQNNNRIEFLAPQNIQAREWSFAVFEPFCGVRLGIAVHRARPHLLLQDHAGNAHTSVPIFRSLATPPSSVVPRGM
jgi:4'-phosphopantetheinyl transferase